MIKGLGTITAYLAWERVSRRRPPTDLTEVPVSADELTPQWLTQALCQSVAGAQVTSVTQRGGSDGSSSRRRIGVEYNEIGQRAGLPSDLFTKSSPRLGNRLVLGLTGTAEGEGIFYSKARPMLTINSPQGYASAYDPRSRRSMLILEDVGHSRGARFGDALQRLTLAEAMDVVNQLAILHGTLWERPALAQGGLRRLRSTPRFQRDFDAMLAWRRASLNGMRRASGVVPGSILDQLPDLWQLFYKSLALHDSLPHTLVHQDPHPGNWFRDSDGRMGLYDWQGVARGFWALDYCYAVEAALDIEDRRAWEQELLEHYLQCLQAAGGPSIPFTEAWMAYRLHPIHGLTFWAGTLGAPRLAPKMQPDEFSLAIIERITQAMHDHDTLDAIRSL
jgi:hypothetical protein